MPTRLITAHQYPGRRFVVAESPSTTAFGRHPEAFALHEIYIREIAVKRSADSLDVPA
jgi:hypothetical protein